MLEKTASIIDRRASRPDRLQVNADASVIAYQLGNRHAPQTMIFDLNRQGYQTAADHALQSAKTTADAIVVSDWFNRQYPKLNQQPLELQPYEESRSAVSRDGQHFLVGTEWYLRYYDRLGPQWLMACP
ncbi:MAG: hypothetical protein ACRESZ_08110 [Methylococcales bacterium]